MVTLFCVQAQQKQGGICFRVDDNQNSKWEEVATIFKKYNLPFTFAANLGILQKESIPIIQNLQALGYEFQDHTPNHFTHYLPLRKQRNMLAKLALITL